MIPQAYTLYDTAVKNALSFGDAPCLVCGDRSLSFSEFLARTESAAAALEARGLAAGDRIAILAGNREEYLIALAAAARQNLVVVAVNWRLSAEELRHVLADTSPRLVLADAQRMETLAEMPGSPPIDIEAVAGNGSTGSPAGPPVPASPDDPFLIIHTAAVSGKARGAVLTHANMACTALQNVSCFGLGRADCCLALLPFFHIMQLVLSLGAMAGGGRNVIMEKFDAKRCVDIMERHKVTLMGSFPPILAGITQAAETLGKTPASLSAVVGIDAPVNIEPFEKAFGADFFLMYGQTETSGAVTLCKYSERPGSAGKPVHLAAVMVEGEDGCPAGKESPGEICVRGPLVFSGYWDEGRLSGPTFAEGWHRTGDLGWMDGEGFLFFAGRKPERELIKPGGENVFPAEVESVLKSHGEVLDAVVIGVPDERFGEAIRAVCVKEEGSKLGEDELKEYVAGRIARYKKPRDVVFVPELPRTPGGAICRNTVKERFGK